MASNFALQPLVIEAQCLQVLAMKYEDMNQVLSDVLREEFVHFNWAEGAKEPQLTVVTSGQKTVSRVDEPSQLLFLVGISEMSVEF